MTLRRTRPRLPSAAARTRSTAVRWALLFLALNTVAASAFENEPDGFGEAKFGMSVERVREVLPGLKEFAADPKEPWALYVVEDQSYLSLKPCNVTLGFFSDKLYEAKFDCGRDEKIKSVLHEHFGPPSGDDGGMSIWRGERAVVTMNRQAMTFALADPVRSQLLHQYLLQKALTREFDAREKAAAATPAPDGSGDSR